jgi:hypothetical protein
MPFLVRAKQRDRELKNNVIVITGVETIGEEGVQQMGQFLMQVREKFDGCGRVVLDGMNECVDSHQTTCFSRRQVKKASICVPVSDSFSKNVDDERSRPLENLSASIPRAVMHQK